LDREAQDGLGLIDPNGSERAREEHPRLQTDPRRLEDPASGRSGTAQPATCSPTVDLAAPHFTVVGWTARVADVHASSLLIFSKSNLEIEASIPIIALSRWSLLLEASTFARHGVRSLGGGCSSSRICRFELGEESGTVLAGSRKAAALESPIARGPGTGRSSPCM
jgi:hypothetical protein